MRTIRELISSEKRIYIFLSNRAIRYRFMSDAEREGITYGDNAKPTERQVDEIMALYPDGTICFLGLVGRICYHAGGDKIIRVDYEKYIDGWKDYIVGTKA